MNVTLQLKKAFLRRESHKQLYIRNRPNLRLVIRRGLQHHPLYPLRHFRLHSLQKPLQLFLHCSVIELINGVVTIVAIRTITVTVR